MIREKPVNLLWTGGWDSTFRLLQLLLEEKKKVHPYYVVDPSRNSTGVEIQSMGKLKKIIQKQHPHTEMLLLPTTYVNVESIDPDEEIIEAYNQLNKFVPLGSQYIWLPAFCKQNDLAGLEISIENGANEEIGWKNLPYLKNSFSDNPENLCEKERIIYTTSKTLFRYFTFPIINLSKKDTFTITKRNGWSPFMKETWFCYQPLFLPLKGLSPCGNCITCRFQIKSGFTWRIPIYSKLFQKTRKFKQGLISAGKYVKQNYVSG